MPNDVELTTESLATAAEESEKNSLINQSVLFAQSFINTLVNRRPSFINEVTVSKMGILRRKISRKRNESSI